MPRTTTVRSKVVKFKRPREAFDVPCTVVRALLLDMAQDERLTDKQRVVSAIAADLIPQSGIYRIEDEA